MSFDPIRILQQLSADGIAFVLIGGIAGRVHGSATVTNDLDVCYRRTKANCERLANTLRELGARLRDPRTCAKKEWPITSPGTRTFRGTSSDQNENVGPHNNC